MGGFELKLWRNGLGIVAWIGDSDSHRTGKSGTAHRTVRDHPVDSSHPPPGSPTYSTCRSGHYAGAAYGPRKKSDDGRPHAPPRSSASPWSFPPRGRLDHVCVDDLGLRGCGVVLTNAATHSSCVGASRGSPDSFSDTLPVPLGCGFITPALSGDGCPRGPCRR